MSKHPTHHKKLIAWVEKCCRLCKPDAVVWIDGSAEQKLQLEQEAWLREN